MNWLIALLSFAAGAVAALLARRSLRAPSARVIEEVYGRKIRFAEQEREQAIRELNANRVEMTTFDERFQALDRRIATLGGELDGARAALARATEEGVRRAAEADGLSGAIAEARRTEALALIECAAAFEERERAFQVQHGAEDEARARRTEAAELRERVAGVSGESRALAAELEARTGELARARQELERRIVELAQSGAEGDELRARVAALEQELGGRGAELEGRSGELARVRAELEQRTRALAERTHEAAELGARLARATEELGTRGAELAARAAELETRTGELARARDEGTDLARELERVRSEAAQLSEELASLAALPGELGEAQRELVRREHALTALRGELQTARARVAELETLPGRLAALREELEQRDGEHEEARAELERAWRERHDGALASKDAELVEERRRSEQRFERAHALELELERARDRVRELTAAGEDRVQGDVEMREQRQRLLTELSGAKAAVAKAEAALGERAGRIAELEGTLRGKDVQLRELARVGRDLEQSQARALKLEQELLRAQHEAEAHEATLETRAKELAELRRELARVQKELEKELRVAETAREKGVAALQEAQAKLRERDETLREKAARAKELEAELKSRPAPGTLVPAARKPNNGRDDLQRIAGIGPVLEKKLNRLGYRTYRQIAALDRDELEKLADKLGLTSDRIRREGWIASAKSVLRANDE